MTFLVTVADVVSRRILGTSGLVQHRSDGGPAFAAGRLAQAFADDAETKAGGWHGHYKRLERHTGWLRP